MILQKKFEKCEDFLILYYLYHKKILKTRVICCLSHNLKLTTICLNPYVYKVPENLHSPFLPPILLDHRHSRWCLSYTPHHGIFFYITWLGPPCREHFYQKCCCTVLKFKQKIIMFSVIFLCSQNAIINKAGKNRGFGDGLPNCLLKEHSGPGYKRYNTHDFCQPIRDDRWSTWLDRSNRYRSNQGIVLVVILASINYLFLSIKSWLLGCGVWFDCSIRW